MIIQNESPKIVDAQLTPILGGDCNIATSSFANKDDQCSDLDSTVLHSP
jgi:hypothetical protein